MEFKKGDSFLIKSYDGDFDNFIHVGRWNRDNVLSRLETNNNEVLIYSNYELEEMISKGLVKYRTKEE